MKFQEKCQARMKEFRRQGVAIVFVSHHLPAVAQLCSQVLLLEEGSAACLGTAGEVIAEYCSGKGSSDHGDVAVSAALRSHAGAGEDVFQVAPGEQLQLDVTLAFRVDVEQATIGVVVWDLTRELYVYGASSDFVGLPHLRAANGDVRTFTFTFDANLTRGLYAIEVNVVDVARHRFLAVARGLRHFHVVEQVSFDGVANLYLSAREVDRAAVSGTMRRVAAGARG
jgi:hypothetical protein